MPGSSDQLSILLHKVEGPVNLGSACRVMANFGLTNLAFSGPLSGMEEEVRRFALSAYSLMASARKCGTIEDLLAPTQVVIGFTPRDPWEDGKTLPYDDLKEKVIALLEQGLKVGLLFGNEAHGLSNDELTHCDFRVALPTHSGFPSMNLSHAVLAGVLPLFGIQHAFREPQETSVVNATQKQLLANKVDLFMDAIEFLGPRPAQSTRQEIEKIWTGRTWYQREWDLLVGLFHKAAVRSALLSKKNK